MAQPNTKTPAMVLQEFTVKNSFAPPEYVLVHSKMGTHENEFHYEVSVANVRGKGFGRSKQVAKHDAASSALEILAEKGLYNAKDNPAQKFNAQSHRNESDGPDRPPVNYVGTLKDMCNENKLPYPIFTEISDVGPPHCREFTYECCVESIKTQSTANTKKQAKQLAAKDMLDKIKDICPILSEKFSAEANALTDRDTEALSKYSEMQIPFDIIPNRAAKVEEFTYSIKKVMDERGLSFCDFTDLFRIPSKENFSQILDKLGIKYELFEMQPRPYIAAINLGIDTPFSVMATGANKESAETNAITSALHHLKIYMTVAER